MERHEARCMGLPVVHATALKPPRKKRVRRIQLELAFYRRQVEELELRLKRVKLHKAQQPHTTKVHFSGADDAFVWNGIAERQLKERLRAQKQQKELVDSQTELIALETELRKLLERFGGQTKKLKTPAKSKQPTFWELSSLTDDKVFSEQLTIVASHRLELLQRACWAPCRPISVDWGLSRGIMEVRSSPRIDKGVVMEMHCGTTVPFNLAVAARAYWRFFRLEHGEMPHKDDATDVSAGTIVRSFSLRLEYEGVVADTAGKYTCQKHVTPDEVSIVWVEYVDVAEFGGVKFSGMQYQKRACMKLRRVPREGPGQQSTSTIVETHFETIPVFHESVADSWLQTQAFIASARRAHAKLNTMVCQIMSHLLVEEDWKETFGS